MDNCFDMTDYILCNLILLIEATDNSLFPTVVADELTMSLVNDSNITLSNSTLIENATYVEADNIITKTLLSIILSLIILLTIGGNVLVIVAILKERNLQGVGNCLVLSLAVADLMVACLVMPLAAVVEITQEWPYGALLCDIWSCCDVLCCTASILHLLAIAMDRYWAVTNIDYIRKRSVRRTSIMIAIAWGVACMVSLPPVVGWKDPDFRKRVEDEKRCLVSQDIGYQVFATFSTFYVPLALTLILYWRIYKVARERIRNRPGSRPKLGTQKISAQTLAPPPMEMSALSEISSSLPESDNSVAVNGTVSFVSTGTSAPPERRRKRRHKKESLESKREKKAAKTLAIITGVFIICWLPFFSMALTLPLCEVCELSSQMFGFLLWLGYVNSMLNPIIYTIFSPDFRSAFRRLLCGNRGRTRVVFYG